MDPEFWTFLLSVYALFLTGFLSGVIAHESGHLLCARIASIPIRRMVIGLGPVLLRGRIGGLALELRLVPLGGYVLPEMNTAPPNGWRLALYVLGGVIGNIFAIGLLVWLHAAGSAPQILREAGMPLVLAQAGILVATQLFFIVASLIPHRGTVDGNPISSDGLQLLGLISPRLANVALLTPYRGRVRPWTMPSKAFLRIGDQLGRPGRHSDPEVRREAWNALRRELAEGGLPPDEEMFVLDILITDGLLCADPALRSELDAWSLRAVQLGPQVKTLISSRGAALVDGRRYEEGKAMLEPLVSAKNTALFDGLLSRIFLARAEHALGDAAAARRLMTEAREIVRTAGGGNVDALIERIENEMQTAPSCVMLMHQNAHSLSRMSP